MNPYKIRFYYKGLCIEKQEEEDKMKKAKSLYAYLDGKMLCDVTKAALDNHMMLNDMKKLIVKENQGHEVTFKVK